MLLASLLCTKAKFCFRLIVQARIEEDDDAEDDESFWKFASELFKKRITLQNHISSCMAELKIIIKNS